MSSVLQSTRETKRELTARQTTRLRLMWFVLRRPLALHGALVPISTQSSIRPQLPGQSGGPRSLPKKITTAEIENVGKILINAPDSKASSIIFAKVYFSINFTPHHFHLRTSKLLRASYKEGFG
jgi:hypothetical protein